MLRKLSFDRIERADEIVFHARIDDADDLGKAAARAVEVVPAGPPGNRSGCAAASYSWAASGLMAPMLAMRRRSLNAFSSAAPRSSKLGQRERRLKRHAHILHDGVDGSVDAHLQPALLHTGGRQARVDVVVGVMGGLGLLARGGDLRMQPGRGILRLLGPLLKIVRPATGACGELLEHRQKRRDAALRYDLARQLVFQLVLGGVHRGHVAAAGIHDSRGIGIALARAWQPRAWPPKGRRAAAPPPCEAAPPWLQAPRCARHGLGAACASSASSASSLSTLGRASATVCIRLLALALHIGELAARGRERIGGGALPRPTPPAQRLGARPAAWESCRAFGLSGAQRLLGHGAPSVRLPCAARMRRKAMRAAHRAVAHGPRRPRHRRPPFPP